MAEVALAEKFTIPERNSKQDINKSKLSGGCN